MPNRATSQTPLSLVYGPEEVLPTELIYGSPRVLAYDELEQEQLRQDDTMLLEEDRLRVVLPLEHCIGFPDNIGRLGR